jgi:hypothetical protein
MRLLIILVLIPLATACAHAQRPTDRLDWLAGCWELRGRSAIIEEQWMRPRGGMMLGMSRTVRGDSASEYETLRIYDADGVLVYAANPSGQAPTEFRTADSTTTMLRFENPAHDFPQRIIYRPVGSDSLVARIEGMRGGTLRGVDFRFRRVACPGSAERSGATPAPPRD